MTGAHGPTDDPAQLSLSQHEIVQLASVAVSGDGDRGTGIVRRLARKYRTLDPLIAEQFIALLRTSPMRKAETAAPVDVESRLPLVREESTPALDNEPIWDDLTSEAMRQLANEHRRADELLAAGLTATRTALFIGPPGVGKTLSARWIARELGKPLALLDLSSVMSSYLGKTGTNLRHVLDYAKSRDCILFLDELDAIAKRRDDVGEIGELKRLVTVLLQEIDAWPSGGLLIAATNHSNLLDPAVWRRFEMVVDFPRPQERQARAALVGFLSGEEGLGPVIDVLAMAYAGTSYSDIERSTARARRASTLQRTPLEETLASDARMRFAELSPQTRRDLAVRLLASTPMSQRRVADLTGVSRDTLRKHATVSRKDGTPS